MAKFGDFTGHNDADGRPIRYGDHVEALHSYRIDVEGDFWREDGIVFDPLDKSHWGEHYDGPEYQGMMHPVDKFVHMKDSAGFYYAHPSMFVRVIDPETPKTPGDLERERAADLVRGTRNVWASKTPIERSRANVEEVLFQLEQTIRG